MGFICTFPLCVLYVPTSSTGPEGYFDIDVRTFSLRQLDISRNDNCVHGLSPLKSIVVFLMYLLHLLAISIQGQAADTADENKNNHQLS